MKRFTNYACCFLLVMTFASCHETSKLALGSDYYLMGDKENPASIKLVHGIGDGFDDIILGEIVDYNMDPKFILIHRKVSDKARAIFEDNPLWLKQNKGADQYWIIDKKYDGINGPLDYSGYLEKRKQLQVSDGVNIRQ